MDAAYLAEFTDGRQVHRALAGDSESFGLELDDGPAADGTYCLRMLEGGCRTSSPTARPTHASRSWT